MRWLFGGMLAASISMLGLSPALAVSCGPGTSGSINIELQGRPTRPASIGATAVCRRRRAPPFIDASNTSSPDILHLSYTLLHIDGDVSFTRAFRLFELPARLPAGNPAHRLAPSPTGSSSS